MSTNSFKFGMDPRRKSFVRAIGGAHAAIAEAMQEDGGITVTELARRLDVDKSVLSRRLKGQTNMTIKALADIAWALGRRVEISLPKKKAQGNRPVVTSVVWQERPVVLAPKVQISCSLSVE